MNGRDEILKKKLKYTEQAVAAQNRRNDILQEHLEMELFTRILDESDTNAAEYIRLMRKKVLLRVRAEVESLEDNGETGN